MTDVSKEFLKLQLTDTDKNEIFKLLECNSDSPSVDMDSISQAYILEERLQSVFTQIVKVLMGDEHNRFGGVKWELHDGNHQQQAGTGAAVTFENFDESDPRRNRSSLYTSDQGAAVCTTEEKRSSPPISSLSIWGDYPVLSKLFAEDPIVIDSVPLPMSKIEFVNGIQRCVFSTYPLMAAIQSHPTPAGIVDMVFNACADSNSRSKFMNEHIFAVSVHWEGHRAGQKKHGKRVLGKKVLTPPVYLAVETGNVIGLRELLRRGFSCTASREVFKLASTKWPEQTLVDVKDIADVAAWEESECVWVADESDHSSMAPIQLAFNLQNIAAFTVLLECVDIIAMTGRLELQSREIPWRGSLPASFGNLQNITELKIEDLHNGPAPSVIFSLKSLTHLDLRGSNYSSLPDRISELSELQYLNVSKLSLVKLPIVQLNLLDKLTFLDCSGIFLTCPPHNIVANGPEAVARYVRLLDRGSVENTELPLVLIGDGEAGKTTLLNALRCSGSGSAAIGGGEVVVGEGILHLPELKPYSGTIGMEKSYFKPCSDSPLSFISWDLGGQEIYSTTQHLFMPRTAVFVLVWRLHEALDTSSFPASTRCDVCHEHLLLTADARSSLGKVYRSNRQGICHAKCVSYENSVMRRLEQIHHIVPDALVVLVATHTDCTSEDDIEGQCQRVAEISKKFLARQAVVEGEPLQLQLHNKGESIRVSSKTGEGLDHLRSQLHAIGERLPSFGEIMPPSYARIRERLRVPILLHQGGDEEVLATIKQGSSRMQWTTFCDLCKECSIFDPVAVDSAVKFFHSTGEIRYFGALTRDPAKQGSDRGAAAVSCEVDPLLNSDVFINPAWLVNTIHSLVRHEYSGLLQRINNWRNCDHSSSDKKSYVIIRRKFYALIQRGLLYESLLPFIWPEDSVSSPPQESDNSPPPQDSANSPPQDVHHKLALLKALNVIFEAPLHESQCQERQWIVPSLLGGVHRDTVEADAFNAEDVPFSFRLIFDSLPAYFDAALVSKIMNRRIADGVDFGEGAACFRMNSEKCLVFADRQIRVKDPHVIFRVDQLSEEWLSSLLCENQVHLAVSATSRRLLNQVITEISLLENEYPGLRRLATLFPCYSCRQSHLRWKTEQSTLRTLSDVHVASTLQEKAQIIHEAKSTPPDLTVLEDLANAEAADLMRQQGLVPEAAADQSQCDQYYSEHAVYLERAWDIYPAFDKLVSTSEWFSVGGRLAEVFASGRNKPTKRYFQEVLYLLENVNEAMTQSSDSATLDERAYGFEIRQITDTLRDRAEETSKVQSADTSSYAGLSKYFRDRLQVFEQVWEACDLFPKLLGTTWDLVQLNEYSLPNGILFALYRSNPKKIIPELAFIYKSIIDLAKQQEQMMSVVDEDDIVKLDDDATGAARGGAPNATSSSILNIGSTDVSDFEIVEYQSFHGKELLALVEVCPDLKVASEQEEQQEQSEQALLTHSSSSSASLPHFLVRCYGYGSSRFSSEYMKMLRAALTLFENTPDDPALEQELADAYRTEEKLIAILKPGVTRAVVQSYFLSNYSILGRAWDRSEALRSLAYPQYETDWDSYNDGSELLDTFEIRNERFFQESLFLLESVVEAVRAYLRKDAGNRDLLEHMDELLLPGKTALALDGEKGTLNLNGGAADLCIAAAAASRVNEFKKNHAKVMWIVEELIRNHAAPNILTDTFGGISPSSLPRSQKPVSLSVSAEYHGEYLCMLESCVQVLNNVVEKSAELGVDLDTIYEEENVLLASIKADAHQYDVKSYYDTHFVMLKTAWELSSELSKLASYDGEYDWGYEDEGEMLKVFGTGDNSKYFPELLLLLQSLVSSLNGVLAKQLQLGGSVSSEMRALDDKERLMLEQSYSLHGTGTAVPAGAGTSILQKIEQEYRKFFQTHPELLDAVTSMDDECGHWLKTLKSINTLTSTAVRFEESPIYFREMLVLGHRAVEVLRDSNHGSDGSHISLGKAGRKSSFRTTNIRQQKITEVLAGMEVRADTLLDIAKKRKELMKTLVSAAGDSIKSVIESSRDRINRYSNVTKKREFVLTTLVDTALPAFTEVSTVQVARLRDIKASNDRFNLVLLELPVESWQELLQGVITVTRNRLQSAKLCPQKQALVVKKKAHYLTDKLRALIDDFRSRAEAYLASQSKKHHLVVDGVVKSSLEKIASTTKTHALNYSKMFELKNASAVKFLKEAADGVGKRINDYEDLLLLRRRSGIPWYFGVGSLGGGSGLSHHHHQHPSSSHKDSSSLATKDGGGSGGGDVAEQFLDPGSTEKLLMCCPAEGTSALRAVQPRVPCSVYISHNTVTAELSKLIVSAIHRDAVDVICRRSEEDLDLYAEIATAKVVIFIIDAFFTEHLDRMSEYRLAMSLGLEILAVIAPEYEITNYQQWWPKAMSAFVMRPLFIDCRNESESPIQIERFLVPTVRNLLRNWRYDRSLSFTPPESVQDADTPCRAKSFLVVNYSAGITNSVTDVMTSDHALRGSDSGAVVPPYSSRSTGLIDQHPGTGRRGSNSTVNTSRRGSNTTAIPPISGRKHTDAVGLVAVAAGGGVGRRNSNTGGTTIGSRRNSNAANGQQQHEKRPPHDGIAREALVPEGKRKDPLITVASGGGVLKVATVTHESSTVARLERERQVAAEPLDKLASLPRKKSVILLLAGQRPGQPNLLKRYAPLARSYLEPNIPCELCALQGLESYYARDSCASIYSTWEKRVLDDRSKGKAHRVAAEAAASSSSSSPSILQQAQCDLRVTCSGPEQHQLLVVDAIAKKAKIPAMPCPRCLNKGILPPFCFQRELCQKVFADNKGGSISCRRCHDFIPLFELLRSNVFISYNWGVPTCPHCSTSYWAAVKLGATGACPICMKMFLFDDSTKLTHMIASEIRGVLESDGGVTTWHDIDRTARGKELNREYEAGILGADVVLLLLNDLYINSANCVKEYHFAMRHGKVVVPVILSGYKGLKFGDDLPSAQWWPDSLDSMAQFDPLYMLDQTHFEPVLTEILKRVHETFYCAPRYPTAKDVLQFVTDYDTWRDCQDTLLSIVRNDSVAKSKAKIEDQLLAAFESMDTNNNGTVELNELVAAISKTDFPLSSEEINALMREADLNDDKHITFDEFKSAMLHIFTESGLNLYGSFIINSSAEESSASAQSRSLQKFTASSAAPRKNTLTAITVTNATGTAVSARTARRSSLNNAVLASSSTAAKLAGGGLPGVVGGVSSTRRSTIEGGGALHDDLLKKSQQTAATGSNKKEKEPAAAAAISRTIALSAALDRGSEGGGGGKREEVQKGGEEMSKASSLDTTVSARTSAAPSRSGATPRENMPHDTSSSSKHRGVNGGKLDPLPASCLH